MGESDISDSHLNVVYHFGAYPLWLLLKDLFDIDITEVCPRVSKEETIVKTESGDLVARVVDLPFEQHLDATYNNDVVFFINSVNVVFESLKIGVEKDGHGLLRAYKFVKDGNNNIYLVDMNSNARVGNRAIAIVLKTHNESE